MKPSTKALGEAYEVIIAAIDADAKHERKSATDAIRMREAMGGASRARGSAAAVVRHSDRARALEIEVRRHRESLRRLLAGDIYVTDLHLSFQMRHVLLAIAEHFDRSGK